MRLAGHSKSRVAQHMYATPRLRTAPLASHTQPHLRTEPPRLLPFAIPNARKCGCRTRTRSPRAAFWDHTSHGGIAGARRRSPAVLWTRAPCNTLLSAILFPIIVTCLMRDLRNGATEKASLVRISLMQRIIAPELENNFFPLSNGRREVLDAAKGGGWWRSNAVPVGALATLIAYADGAPAI